MHGRAAVWHSYLRLLQMGFTKLRCCQRTGALLPHRFSFSPARRGVFFSVALSVGSPRPAVSWHLALGSPDFPHACARDCPAHSRLYYTLFYEQCIELTLQPSQAPHLGSPNRLDGRSPPGILLGQTEQNASAWMLGLGTKHDTGMFADGNLRHRIGPR